MNNPKNTTAEIFLEYKRSVKQSFLNAYRALYGGHGCAKLADAAWYIATNAPDVSRYLQGDLVGVDKSYTLLMQASTDAFAIAQMLDDIKTAYHANGTKSKVTSHLFIKPTAMPENAYRPSPEEGYAHILRGLISYHERMTMGEYPSRDFYLDALKFALACVEEKIPK